MQGRASIPAGLVHLYDEIEHMLLKCTFKHMANAILMNTTDHCVCGWNGTERLSKECYSKLPAAHVVNYKLQMVQLKCAAVWILFWIFTTSAHLYEWNMQNWTPLCVCSWYGTERVWKECYSKLPAARIVDFKLQMVHLKCAAVWILFWIFTTSAY